ncbi:Uma2 family endonuclease [Synechocystis sp. LEGE 06083]|uniref:Uma2 family endonuclease n=2 Tax=unclassified Synechocystis TaxID=2640012 RepID=UPI00187EE129|nr:Uma2 family endonuclease [Synechocystis sp. LEGE 06083]MBE9193914.1 Uma2 family endonuclease [Synechocystis sp. LEGE 06083]
MTVLTVPIKSDTWIKASWEEFIQAAENPDYEKGKFYYYQDHLRIEMSPVSRDHAGDHGLVNGALGLYVALRNIPVTIRDTCSYRQPGQWEVQPDISCHVGDNAMAIPYGTGIVNLNDYPPPDLVIEIANTSLADDQGKKRLLYEDLSVKEYWIVDVKVTKILGFKMKNQGSYQIRESLVLPGLKLAILEEGLQKSRQTNHSEVMRWLLQQFS